MFLFFARCRTPQLLNPSDASNCCFFQVINLSWCGKIGNLSLKTIADSCSHLTSIDLTGCTLISDSSVVALANSYAGPRLVDLKLQSCELITATAVSTIAQR